MSRKAVASFILAAIALSFTSCMVWSMKDVRTMTERPAEGTPVVSVVKISGETVQFSKSDPGRVRGFAVVGTAKDAVARRIDITGPFPSIKERADGTIYEVVDGQGRVHSVRQVLARSENQMTILASTWMQVSIPLSDARQIEVRKTSMTLPVLLAAGVVAISVLPLLFVHVRF